MSSLIQQQIIDGFPFKNNSSTDEVPMDSDNVKPHTKSVAHYLHESRVKAGLTIEDMANTLRISQHYLQAIEDCNLEILPERVYTLGFIRSYAKYLGLDSDEIVKRFKNEILGEETLNMPYVATALNEESSLPSRAIIWGIVALLLVCTVGSWLYFNVFTTTTSEPSPMPDVIKHEIEQSLMMDTQAPLNSIQDTIVNNSVETNPTHNTESLSVNSGPAVTANTPTNDTASTSPISADTITFSFTELTWIEIKDAHGKTIINNNFNVGDTYTIVPQEGMRFSTGNAGGIKIKKADGSNYTLGKHGEIIKNIPFDSHRFKKP